jgi:hypothetical protein
VVGGGGGGRNGRGSTLEEFEDGMDVELFRKGVVRSNTNPKCKNKGPRPTDKDQKQWAPLHYFVHSVAGTVISMMNKLGMFKLRINYGFKSVSDYLFHYVMSTLGCFIDSSDENNASRYYESYQCRMVAETVMRTTFMSMAICENMDTAIMHAAKSLTYNAIHPSLLPVLQERLIQRLIQYEPLLGMATLGICMDVPVVSMQSIMQLMNGQTVTNEEEREAMKKFVEDAFASNNIIQYILTRMPAEQNLIGFASSNLMRMHAYVLTQLLSSSRANILTVRKT